MLQPIEIPLTVYAHFPWCVRKCPYCDFNSHRAPAGIPEERYVDALLEDLRHDLESHDLESPVRRPIGSVFLGGGTPSLFSPDAIHRFISGVRQLVATQTALEVTMEANPGTIEHGRFADYRAAGVNRVSLGVQSFDDRRLQQLGRIHGVKEVRTAVEELQNAGIDNFNIDLMFGLPGQDIAAAVRDVESAIALRPSHISHYQLTLEPGTPFFFRPPPLPDSDETWDMQIACQEVLARAGYAQYEVSAYAQPGRECAHNLNYWRFGDYFGLGAGAHGKLSRPEGVTRSERRKYPLDYLKQAVAHRVTLRDVSRADLTFEFMLNVLRLRMGFDRRMFASRTGLAGENLIGAVAEAEERGLLATHSEIYVPTELGWRFLTDLQALFLPEKQVSEI